MTLLLKAPLEIEMDTTALSDAEIGRISELLQNRLADLFHTLWADLDDHVAEKIGRDKVDVKLDGEIML